jgi:hypothetical protein
MSKRGDQGVLYPRLGMTRWTADPAWQQRPDHHARPSHDKGDQLRWPDGVLRHEQFERDPCRETGRNGEQAPCVLARVQYRPAKSGMKAATSVTL